MTLLRQAHKRLCGPARSRPSALAEDVEHKDGVVGAESAAGLADDDGCRLDAPLNAHVLRAT